ncbi:heterogeneous nuclear ribonucleoprotein K [Caerostris extrusa]|uniref:Heterogeneous nuclear ribonucleoprotein K n=1 Tax=Caerostris extrusa TaxID=172846 RepID=A0AAV4UX24_CAEEX|nr:heterogeneous nuclear ribonucleoprotein K [Caerostris extrusa]
MSDTETYKTSNKREASQDSMGDCEGPSKRPRSGGRAVDVRFLVQSKNAGAIIGKGGSNINRLRTEFTASVTVPDCPGPERILAIVADVDTLGDILLDVLPKLDDYSHHRNMEFDCELRMLLHQSHAGCLIGKGGSRIKELREIKIFSNCCPNSTERIVQISGYPNVVVDCVKEVCHIISAAPIKGPNKQYDPHHFNPLYCNDYGGYEDQGPKGRGRGSFRGRPPPPAWRDEVVDNFSFGGPDGGSNRGRGGFGGSFGNRGRGMAGQGPNFGNRWNQMGGPGGGTGGGNLGGWKPNDVDQLMVRILAVLCLKEQVISLWGMGGPPDPEIHDECWFRWWIQGAGGPGINGPDLVRLVHGRSTATYKPQGYIPPVPNTGELFHSKPVSKWYSFESSMENPQMMVLELSLVKVVNAFVDKGEIQQQQ